MLCPGELPIYLLAATLDRELTDFNPEDCLNQGGQDLESPSLIQ